MGLFSWTASVPVLGPIIGWVKAGVCWTLVQPPELVLDTAKVICKGIFGECG